MLHATERRQFDVRFDRLWSIDTSQVIEPANRHQHSIKDVEEGGVIKLDGDIYVVQGTATYTETNDAYSKDKDHVVTELVLFSLATGETRFIEWSVDDALEVSFTERKLKSSEVRNRLKDDEGGKFDIDDDIDEAVENEWPLRFDFETYVYDDDWAFRYDSSDGRRLKGYMYEFGDEDTGWLTIEAWAEDVEKDKWDYEVFISSDIEPTKIEVISLGGKVKAA